MWEAKSTSGSGAKLFACLVVCLLGMGRMWLGVMVWEAGVLCLPATPGHQPKSCSCKARVRFSKPFHLGGCCRGMLLNLKWKLAEILQRPQPWPNVLLREPRTFTTRLNHAITALDWTLSQRGTKKLGCLLWKFEFLNRTCSCEIQTLCLAMADMTIPHTGQWLL